MPAHATITVKLDDDLKDHLDTKLKPALQAAGELAAEADRLLTLAPGDVNPVLYTRAMLAPLQASLDAFRDAAADLVHEEAIITDD